MSKKICSNCRFAIQDVPEMFCLFRKLHTKDGLFENCHCFLPKIIFSCITASPKVLAEKLVYCNVQVKTIPSTSREHPGGVELTKGWYSTIIRNKVWSNEDEAIAATVARLKEVAEDD